MKKSLRLPIANMLRQRISELDIRIAINNAVNEILQETNMSAAIQQQANGNSSMSGGRRRHHRGGMISVPEVDMNVTIDVDGHVHNGKSGKITGIDGETIEVTLNNVNSDNKHIVIPGLTGDQLNQVVTEAELAALESNAAGTLAGMSSNVEEGGADNNQNGGRRRRKSKKSKKSQRKSKKSQRKSKKSQKKNQ